MTDEQRADRELAKAVEQVTGLIVDIDRDGVIVLRNGQYRMDPPSCADWDEES